MDETQEKKCSRLVAFRELFVAWKWWRRGRSAAARVDLFVARTILLQGRYPLTREYKRFLGYDP